MVNVGMSLLAFMIKIESHIEDACL